MKPSIVKSVKLVNFELELMTASGLGELGSVKPSSVNLVKTCQICNELFWNQGFIVSLASQGM
jgi:hypothetical protein